MEVIIKTQRNKPHFSGWYNQEVDHIDYYLRTQTKKFFIGGVAVRTDGNKPIKDKDNMYLVFDYDDTVKEIMQRIKQLKKNKFKYFCLYCGRGMLGTPNKQTDVFKFIKWVKDESYKFNKFYRIESLNNGSWEFGGNLDKYSCAFSFRIFDVDTVNQIRDLTKDMLMEIIA